ncbi:hypothetical protein HDU98_008477, partial [Podochytrium sp. JEL0797]
MSSTAPPPPTQVAANAPTAPAIPATPAAPAAIAAATRAEVSNSDSDKDGMLPMVNNSEDKGPVIPPKPEQHKKTRKYDSSNRTKAAKAAATAPTIAVAPMYRKRQVPNNAVHLMNREMETDLINAISKLKADMRLTVDKESVPHLSPQLKNTKQYGSQTRGLLYFLVLIQDFESCLILESYTFNEVVPSINPTSIAMYLQWKTRPVDEFVTDASLEFKLDKH